MGKRFVGMKGRTAVRPYRKWAICERGGKFIANESFFIADPFLNTGEPVYGFLKWVYDWNNFGDMDEIP